MHDILKCLEFDKYIISLGGGSFDNLELLSDIDSNKFLENLERMIQVNPNFCNILGRNRRNILRGMVDSLDVYDYDMSIKRMYVIEKLNRAKKVENRMIKNNAFGSVSYYDISHNPKICVHQMNGMLLKSRLKSMRLYRKFINNASAEIKFLLNVVDGNEMYDPALLGDRGTFPDTINYILSVYPESFDEQTLSTVKEIMENETYSSRKNISFPDRVNYFFSKRSVLKTIKGLQKEKALTKTLL